MGYKKDEGARERLTQELGITIRDDEDIHHRDLDPANRDISNLMVLKRYVHRRLHASVHYLNKMTPCIVGKCKQDLLNELLLYYERGCVWED